MINLTKMQSSYWDVLLPKPGPQAPATPAEQISRSAHSAPPLPVGPQLSELLGTLRQPWRVSTSLPRHLPSTLRWAKGTSVRLHLPEVSGEQDKPTLGSGIPSPHHSLNHCCGCWRRGHRRINDCSSIFPCLLFLGELRLRAIQKPRFHFCFCLYFEDRLLPQGRRGQGPVWRKKGP